jgi:hypothetical protein
MIHPGDGDEVAGRGAGTVDVGAEAVEQRAEPEQEKRRGPQAVKELRQRCEGHAPGADGRAWRTSEVGSILGSQVVLPAAWWRTHVKLGPRGRTKESDRNGPSVEHRVDG